MRAMGISICGIALALCAVACSAQCTTGLTTQNFDCAGPDGCSAGVTVAYPVGADQYGAAIEPNVQECCGQLFSSFMMGGGCEPEGLKRPGVKERLSELSRTSEVLVADCKGRYALYKPAPTKERLTASWALLNDRMLR